MDTWPNQEALNKALNVYRAAMRSFIISCLRQIQGTDVESAVTDSLGYRRADEIERLLIQTDRSIESVIDINDFPYIVNKNWDSAFERTLNDDKTFRNQLWLIVECRNAEWAHPPDGDAEFESTWAHLFFIADVLGKINKPDAKVRVEAIRDELFPDDMKECLEKAEQRLKDLESEKSEAEKSLATAESEKNEYAEKNAVLSKQVDEKENQRKKLDKQLKRAKTQNDKYKKDIAGTKQRLEKSEAAQADYKNRLEATSKDLEDAKKEWQACEDSLRSTSGRLEETIEEWVACVEHLTALRKLFTVAAIGKQEVQEVFQSVYPPIETDSTVRILDRRGVDKKKYLLDLLEQKQPTLIYVQSEDMVELLLERVVPEKADLIEKHGEHTSESEEREILEKLKNGEKIAVVSDTAFPTLVSPHRIEHFVFCHLVPGLDKFFKQCEPAFASEKNAYLHLICNGKEDGDIKRLNRFLEQEPPDREELGEHYRELKKHVAENLDFNEHVKANVDLKIVKLQFETMLTIFEELGLLEQNEDWIKFLPTPSKENSLYNSETYCGVVEKLKQEIVDFYLKQPIEQIWAEILEKLNVDSERISRGSNIHKVSLRVSEAENSVQPITGVEQNEVKPSTIDVWPQRGMSPFNSLRQQAARNFSDTNNIMSTVNERNFSESPFDLESPYSEDEEDYENKYDLAIQFAQEHGINTLEEGVAQLIKDRDDPDYDFTEDETNMLHAFQDALENFQTQSEQSTEMVERDEGSETSQAPKPPRANAKVTEEQVRGIRSRSAAGESNSELAKEFNLSSTAIGNIIRRKTWKDVE